MNERAGTPDCQRTISEKLKLIADYDAEMSRLMAEGKIDPDQAAHLVRHFRLYLTDCGIRWSENSDRQSIG